MKISAIDFETANGSPASVCAVGISEFDEGELCDSLETLIRPDTDMGPFSPFNIQVHGIHPDDVKYAPDFRKVYPAILEHLSGSLVTAHNARFDMGCLSAACRYYDLPVPEVHYFDTLELSRKVFPTMRHHRLNDMCTQLNIDLDHHNAGSDAHGCLLIAVEIMNLTGIYDINELLKECHTRIYRMR